MESGDEQPDGVQVLKYCTTTGMLATDACPGTDTGYYKSSNVPGVCTAHNGNPLNGTETTGTTTDTGTTTTTGSGSSAEGTTTTAEASADSSATGTTAGETTTTAAADNETRR